MSNFSARAVCATDNFPVDYHTAANAGSERDEHRRTAALTAALPRLTQRGYICVVSRPHAQARHTAQRLVQVENAPVQIDAAVDAPVFINRARNADADSQNFRRFKVFLPDPCRNFCRNFRQNCFSIVLYVRRYLSFFDQSSRVVQ